MKKKLPVKILDIVIILLFTALTVTTGFAMLTRATDAPMVVIQGPHNRTWIFPLDEYEERTVRVRGVLGDDTVVRISGGYVWAESSPCDNQTCVGMGRVNADSWWPWIACLPNNVMFMIEGTHASGHIDGAAR